MDRTSVARLGAGTMGGIIVGAALALVSTRWLTFTPPEPFVLPIPAAQALLVGILGALFTLAAFAFWMRTIAVNLVAGIVPPGILAAYLGDRFQANLLVATASAVAFVTTLLASLPEDDDTVVPFLGIAVSVLLAIASLFALLYAMTNSLVAVDVSRIVRAICEQALVGLQRPSPGSTRKLHLPPDPASNDLLADATGWVSRVDVEGILAALPSGAHVAVDVAPGDFVMAGTRIGRAWEGHAVIERPAAIARHVVIVSSRTEADDVVYAIDQIVDIGSRALGAGARDMTLARETIGHLGVLMLATMDRRVPGVPSFRGDDGRILTLLNDLAWPDLLRRSFDPLRIDGARWPVIARQILSTLGAIHERRVAVDDETGARELRRLARSTVDECRSGEAIEADVRDLVDHAVRLGLVEDDER